VILIPHASEIKMNRLINLRILKGVALILHEIGMCFSTALRNSRVKGQHSGVAEGSGLP